MAKRTVWVKSLGITVWGGDLTRQYAISTEFHDGIVYNAHSVKEAVKKYEADRCCEVGEVITSN